MVVHIAWIPVFTTDFMQTMFPLRLFFSGDFDQATEEVLQTDLSLCQEDPPDPPTHEDDRDTGMRKAAVIDL